MKKEVHFKRNVYAILIGILLLAILIQVARSQFVLQFNQNEQWMTERLALMDREPAALAAADVNGQYACIAYDGHDTISSAVMENTARTMAYMKQPSHAFDLNREALPYSECSHVLVATSKLDLTGDISTLISYVNDGGSVFFMQTLEITQHYYQLYRKLGVLSFGDTGLTTGIHLTSNVLIGENGLKTGADFINNAAISVELDEHARLLAESLEGVPLMWHRPYGAGSFIVFNGEMLEQKSNRGLIAGGFSLMKPVGFYPVFNAKLFYIDDFPSPIAKGLNVDIYREYKKDMPAFYRDVWWPDMLKAAKRYNVKYTAAVIQSYTDNVTPPFQHPIDQESHNLISYGREVIKSGGEISIHGYNHQSLTMDKSVSSYFGYKAWMSQEDMAASIEEVVRYVGSAFPNYTAMSYVPPSNVLSAEGREALKDSWSDLAVIASLYDTDYSNRAYVQEYEIAEDGMIELPRITSGYYEDEYMHWLSANAITLLGIYSHFIHPDDLIDKERSRNQNWEDLYEDFTSMLSGLNKKYPWLRDMTSTEAGLAIAQNLTSEVKIEQRSDEIIGEVKNYTGELYYILRTDRPIKKQNHCTVQKIDEHTYLVTVQDTKFAVELGGER